MTLLQVQDLVVRRGRRRVLDGISLRIEPGEVVGLLGPNGAGKTTLLRAALGLVAHEGRSSLARMSPGARARAAAFLPQSREIAWPMAVADLVALGRIAHPGGGRSARDHDAVHAALAAMDLHPLRHRAATGLSGGEQARVLIARALAQEARLLIADEPAAGLDPAAQMAVMQVFADLARNVGPEQSGQGQVQGQDERGVLVTVHDLGLAARFCTRLVLLDKGRVVADGPPARVLTPAHLAQVFGIIAHLGRDAAGGMIVQPIARLPGR